MGRALITGASGFIGHHLAAALLRRGEDVACVVRPTSETRQLESLGVTLYRADVTDGEAISPVIADVDVVYHLAGLVKAVTRRQMMTVNEGGVHNLLTACAARTTPPVVVYVSSMAAVGPASGGEPRDESDPPAPVSHYGRSKRAGELVAQSLAHAVPITTIRPALVFGEGDKNSLAIFRPLARWGVHMIPGYVTRRISSIHAADLAELLILAAGRGRRLAPCGDRPKESGQGYYFAVTEDLPTYAEFGRMIGAAVGREKVIVFHHPPLLAWTAAAATQFTWRLRGRAAILNLDKVREALAGTWACSAARARDELDFKPAAPLFDRIRQTADWYRAQGYFDWFRNSARARRPRNNGR
jgi:nucleoside-diphosphate-sugar epimerase